MKDEFRLQIGELPVSRKLSTRAFAGLGPVDVIVGRPRALIELKWSCQQPGKIFECVWDAIKLALLGSQHGYDAMYIVTGASMDSWAASECADLFDDGELDRSSCGLGHSSRDAALTTGTRLVRTW